MNKFFERKRSSKLFQIFSSFISLTFIVSLITSPASLYAQSKLNLPEPGTMVNLSQGFTPTLIKAITIDPTDALKFDFIIDTGNENLDEDSARVEADKLVKYFLAALTIPEEELWVNLSPYEDGRIIPQNFGTTEMGRDLLAQDYLLKQLSASLMYPDGETGSEFWQKIHDKAKKMYGNKDLPMNTFNKIWIVPDKAVVFEQGQNALVVESRLSVMLEEDYLALKNNMDSDRFGTKNLAEGDAKVISKASTDVVREVLIPEIEKEVNEGKNFVQLRQIYNAMILAMWYKENLKDSLLGKIYVDQNKTAGVDAEDKTAKDKIFNQYIAAFKKGVYDYTKNEFDVDTLEFVPRRYFSGGFASIVAGRRLAPRVQETKIAIPKNVSLAKAGLPQRDFAMVTAATETQGKTMRVGFRLEEREPQRLTSQQRTEAAVRAVQTYQPRTVVNAVNRVMPNINPVALEAEIIEFQAQPQPVSPAAMTKFPLITSVTSHPVGSIELSQLSVRTASQTPYSETAALSFDRDTVVAEMVSRAPVPVSIQALRQEMAQQGTGGRIFRQLAQIPSVNRGLSGLSAGGANPMGSFRQLLIRPTRKIAERIVAASPRRESLDVDNVARQVDIVKQEPNIALQLSRGEKVTDNRVAELVAEMSSPEVVLAMRNFDDGEAAKFRPSVEAIIKGSPTTLANAFKSASTEPVNAAEIEIEILKAQTNPEVLARLNAGTTTEQDNVPQLEKLTQNPIAESHVAQVIFASASVELPELNAAQNVGVEQLTAAIGFAAPGTKTAPLRLEIARAKERPNVLAKIISGQITEAEITEFPELAASLVKPEVKAAMRNFEPVTARGRTASAEALASLPAQAIAAIAMKHAPLGSATETEFLNEAQAIQAQPNILSQGNQQQFSATAGKIAGLMNNPAFRNEVKVEAASYDAEVRMELAKASLETFAPEITIAAIANMAEPGLNMNRVSDQVNRIFAQPALMSGENFDIEFDQLADVMRNPQVQMELALLNAATATPVRQDLNRLIKISPRAGALLLKSVSPQGPSLNLGEVEDQIRTMQQNPEVAVLMTAGKPVTQHDVGIVVAELSRPEVRRQVSAVSLRSMRSDVSPHVSAVQDTDEQIAANIIISTSANPLSINRPMLVKQIQEFNADETGMAQRISTGEVTSQDKRNAGILIAALNNAPTRDALMNPTTFIQRPEVNAVLVLNEPVMRQILTETAGAENITPQVIAQLGLARQNLNLLKAIDNGTTGRNDGVAELVAVLNMEPVKVRFAAATTENLDSRPALARVFTSVQPQVLAKSMINAAEGKKIGISAEQLQAELPAQIAAVAQEIAQRPDFLNPTGENQQRLIAIAPTVARLMNVPEIRTSVSQLAGRRDFAMVDLEAKGGIDFNRALLNLELKRDGNGVVLPITQQSLENLDIGGFSAEITDVALVPDLQKELGIK